MNKQEFDRSMIKMLDEFERTVGSRLQGHLLYVGTVILFAGDIIPKKWIVCDGSALSRQEYPELFERIGTKFGEGDGSSTFNIPNLSSVAEGLRYMIVAGNTASELASIRKFRTEDNN